MRQPTVKELETVRAFVKLLNSQKTSGAFKFDRTATIQHTYRESKELLDTLEYRAKAGD